MKIFFSNQSKKFLRNQDKFLFDRILKKINKLLENPFSSDSKSLSAEKLYRVCVGDYRILYRINYKLDKLIIFKIGKRGNVYD